MKELIIDKLGDNQRLDKYLSKYLSASRISENSGKASFNRRFTDKYNCRSQLLHSL